MSPAPTTEEWNCQCGPSVQKILEQQAQDYSIDYGLYTEPGVPHYDGREILLIVTGLSDYVTGHGACNNL